MRIRTVTFTGALGDRLAGELDLPDDGQPRATALMAHCFTCTKDLTGARHLSTVLTHAGLAVLRFDFTGLGQSEGELVATSFSSNVADLVKAADFLGQELAPPQLLVGHSLGGAAVLQATGDLPSVRGVVTIGAPAELSHVTRLFTDSAAAVEAVGSAEVAIGGRSFRLGRQFLAELDGDLMRETIATLRRALLVLHAPLDRIVGIDNAGAIFAAAKHPKSFVSLDNADHLLSRADDARYAGAVIAAWVERYLVPTAATAPPPAPPATDAG